MERIDPQTDWLWGMAMSLAEGLLCGGWPQEARFTFALVSAESDLRGVICGGGWVVLWCSLKLATGYVVFEASWEGLWCRPRSAAACSLPRATWDELQSDLQMVGCHLCYAWRHLGEAKIQTYFSQMTTVLGLELLSKRYETHLGQMVLAWVCECLRNFWKVHSVEETEYLFVKATDSRLSGITNFECGGVSGNHSVEPKVLARLTETQTWCPPVPAGWGGGTAHQGNNGTYPDRLPLQPSPWSHIFEFLSICPSWFSNSNGFYR